MSQFVCKIIHGCFPHDGKSTLFEPLANGLIETLCDKFKKAGVPYGFGGIAILGDGMLPAERIIMEHYRLGSTRATWFKGDGETKELLPPGEWLPLPKQGIICIDTGCGKGGRLTAMIIAGNQFRLESV